MLPLKASMFCILLCLHHGLSEKVSGNAMLQVSSRKSNSHPFAEHEAWIETMARQVADGYTLSQPESEAIRLINETLVGESLPKLFAAMHEDQKSLDHHAGNSSQCVTSAASDKQAADQTKQDLVSQQSAHDASAANILEVQDSLQTSQSLLDAWLATLASPSNIAPTDLSAIGDWLTSNLDWYNQSLQSFLLLKNKSDAESANLATMQAAYDIGKQSLVDKTCLLRSQAESAASHHEDCIAMLKLYNETLKATFAEQSSREADYKSMKKVQCFLNVLKLASENSSQAFDSCVSQPIDTSDLSLTVPDFDAAGSTRALREAKAELEAASSFSGSEPATCGTTGAGYEYGDRDSIGLWLAGEKHGLYVEPQAYNYGFYAFNYDTSQGTYWGYPTYDDASDYWAAGIASHDLTGVTHILSHNRAFLFFNKNAGTGFCVGRDNEGGDCSTVDFTGMTEVYQLAWNGFIAFNKNEGKGACWPSAFDCSSVDFSGTTNIHATEGAFLALNKDAGTGTCWGRADLGGQCDTVDFTGVTDVYANSEAFVAFNKKAGTAVCWGLNYPGAAGDCTHVDFTGVTEIYNTMYHFMALRSDGTAASWGGGTQPNWIDCSTRDFSGVTEVYGSSGAFLGVNLETGEKTCCGYNDKGGECDTVDLTGVTKIVTHGYVHYFLAIKEDGTSFSWGQRPISCPIDFTGATDIIPNRGEALVALNRDAGTGACCGSSSYGGDCSSIDFSFLKNA